MDYISREAALKLSYSTGRKPTQANPYGDMREVVDVADIESLPAADVREVVRGEWRKSELFNEHPECPVCSYVSTERSNFCPNCGAMMGGKDNA